MKAELSPLLYDSHWLKTQQKSKYDFMIQIHLMNEYVDELKTGNFKKDDSIQYKQNCKLPTILRNLYTEEHCQAASKIALSV